MTSAQAAILEQQREDKENELKRLREQRVLLREVLFEVICLLEPAPDNERAVDIDTLKQAVSLADGALTRTREKVSQ